MASTPTLPNELLLPIIKLALPPHIGFSTQQERSQLLLTFSRVSRAFHDTCTPLLYSHVLLPTAARAQRFVQSLQIGAEAKERAGFVRSMRLGAGARREGAFGDAEEALRVLEKCRGVQKLYLSCIDDFRAEALELLEELTHLHLHYIEFVTAPTNASPPILPSLARLNIANDHPAGHTSLLNPTSLPSLTHLSLPTYYFRPADLTHLESLAPNLETLLLGGQLLMTPEVLANSLSSPLAPFLALCAKLQTVSLSGFATGMSFLLPLPRPLRTLRILGSRTISPSREGLALNAVRALRRIDCVALSDLKELWLPRPWVGVISEGWGAEARRELADLCNERGIELKWYEGESLARGGTVESWERNLDDLV